MCIRISGGVSIGGSATNMATPSPSSCRSPDFKKSNGSNKKIWRGSIIGWLVCCLFVAEILAVDSGDSGREDRDEVGRSRGVVIIVHCLYGPKHTDSTLGHVFKGSPHYGHDRVEEDSEAEESSKDNPVELLE